MRKLRKGFTIVELVIVIAVIAVLTAVLVPTFISLSKKAKESVDKSLVANLNKALAVEEAERGKKPETMYEAVEGLKNQGYLIPQLVTKSGEELVYNISKNSFFLAKDVDSSKSYEYWHIESSVPSTQKWAIYAHNWEGDSAENLSVSFDAGEETGIKTVSFVGGHDAIIRTNSLETTLSVNAPLNHVTRYGKAGVVEPLITADHSFEDRGSSAWVTLNGGRFVVTPQTSVEKLYLDVDKENASQALSITLQPGTSMPELVRPALNLEDGETVKIVEVQTSSSTETLYLRGDSTIEEGNVFSSPDGGQTMNAVTAETASETAVAIANAYVAGEVVETGLTEQEKADAVVDTKTAAEIEEMEEETGADLSQYAARIGYKGYATFKAALDAAKEGETISLMKDVDLTDSSLYTSNRLWVLKNISIDGCNNTATVTLNGFGICTEKVTFKNITIKTNAAGSRCVDVRNGQSGIGKFVEEVNLEHVYLDTTVHASGYDQPLTIGGNSSNFKDENGKVKKTKINISNQSLIQTNTQAVAYYAIITFNPIDLSIKDSTIKGWANIYFKAPDGSYGGRGSIVNVDNSKLYANNIYGGSSNSFAMIMIEDGTSSEKIKINIKNSEVHVDAKTDQKQAFVGGSSNSKYFELNLLAGNKVYFNDSDTAVAYFNAGKGAFSVANGNEVYSSRITSTLVPNILASTQQLRDDGEGKYTVVAK